jgi:hypothetical protein
VTNPKEEVPSNIKRLKTRVSPPYAGVILALAKDAWSCSGLSPVRGGDPATDGGAPRRGGLSPARGGDPNFGTVCGVTILSLPVRGGDPYLPLPIYSSTVSLPARGAIEILTA